MAVFGNWQDCAAQVQQGPGFSAAFNFVRDVLEGSHPAAQWLRDLPEGETRRVELDGDRLYAMLMHAPTRLRADQQLEAHRRYADVQVVVTGNERMELAPVDGLTVASAYEAGREFTLYQLPETSSTLVLRDRSCVVLFPADAHAPLQAAGSTITFSRRLVVKVQL